MSYIDGAHDFYYRFVQNGEPNNISLGSWRPPGPSRGSTFMMWIIEDRRETGIIRDSLLAGEFPIQVFE